MKHCSYCGKEYPDEVDTCPLDGNPLQGAGPSDTPQNSPKVSQIRGVNSPEEQGFWQRMTFRQFAVLLIRLQALWQLFYVVIDLTYLPGYLSTLLPERNFDVLPPEMKQTFYLAVFRIVLRVGVAFVAFRYADSLIRWLVRGWVSEQSPNKSVEPTGARHSSN